MKLFVKQLFAFNRRQQRGIVVLLILLFVAASAGWWWPVENNFPTDDKLVDRQFRDEVVAFLTHAADSASTSGSEHNFFAEPPKAKALKFNLFVFNPNHLDDDGWKRLGLSDRQIRSIRNYQAKGGKFYTKKDVSKLYCLSAKDFARLEPYIVIPDSRKPVDSIRRERFHYQDKKLDAIVEINSADSALLTTIRGIGPAFARRIVKYRERLGGFVSKSQLLEVYGMDSARFLMLEPRIAVDTSRIRKLNLNKASFKDLLRHPYLEFYIVKAICNERETRHGFDHPSDLLSVKLMYKELYMKIEPYLCTTDPTQ